MMKKLAGIIGIIGIIGLLTLTTISEAVVVAPRAATVQVPPASGDFSACTQLGQHATAAIPADLVYIYPGADLQLKMTPDPVDTAVVSVDGLVFIPDSLDDLYFLYAAGSVLPGGILDIFIPGVTTADFVNWTGSLNVRVTTATGLGLWLLIPYELKPTVTRYP
jgi:hypothetical protein